MKDTILSSPGVIARPRVEARLRETAEAAALTLVQAPLGAGKSVAVAAALRGRHAVAWIDAKPWDRSAFAATIVAAVRHARPDFGRITLGAIAAGADAAHVGRTFAEDLTHVDVPLTIVVDGVQAFADDAAFGRFTEA